jgi:hypothetical protein
VPITARLESGIIPRHRVQEHIGMSMDFLQTATELLIIACALTWLWKNAEWFRHTTKSTGRAAKWFVGKLAVFVALSLGFHLVLSWYFQPLPAVSFVYIVVFALVATIFVTWGSKKPVQEMREGIKGAPWIFGVLARRKKKS